MPRPGYIDVTNGRRTMLSLRVFDIIPINIIVKSECLSELYVGLSAPTAVRPTSTAVFFSAQFSVRDSDLAWILLADISNTSHDRNSPTATGHICDRPYINR